MLVESRLLSRTGQPAARHARAFGLNRHQNGVWLPKQCGTRMRSFAAATIEMGEK
jgi:hypothetical protein